MRRGSPGEICPAPAPGAAEGLPAHKEKGAARCRPSVCLSLYWPSAARSRRALIRRRSARFPSATPAR